MNFADQILAADPNAASPFADDPELAAAVEADFQALLAQVLAAPPMPAVQWPANVVSLAAYKARQPE
ncbi:MULTISPECIES: hypothetical protein [Pseudomonas]|uniref:Uncharacterized protein n=1 Tax=Pseudomonas putida NBRC 14164 TaxID=1211579 RepID=A0ABN5UKV7_PSEPU|nr:MULTISPECIES: hypothetical protein [Pseudomonas]MCX9135591.1 hypothetical protein [Pseudomonas sp. DCB_PUT]MDD1969584.1 hypothetical protein [Pseudomonas putida]MDO1464815.1 hypothetical protein [Pseudomonas putida]MDO1470185.1 hypothetical protein [Pseudomonas putida]MDZ7325905.1 hypothetical protein [Pseudomonas sp. SDS3-8]